MASPNRTLEHESSIVRGGTASLGKNVTVKGQIFAREDLTIDGEIEGTVECHEHRLTIGPNARVQAALKAREIVIHGSIHGNVDATDKIDIKKEAKLVGDIKTSRIVIEDGAYFKGSIDISKAAAPKNVVQSASAPVGPSQTAQSPAPQPVQTVITGAGGGSR
jgi:cytoskeletal protein CcmA (bactofilin family)